MAKEVTAAATAQIKQFANVLRKDFPNIWKNVTKAYTQKDVMGRKLAQIDNTESDKRERAIAGFPTYEEADQRHLSFEGLNRYLLGVLEKMDNRDDLDELKAIVRGKHHASSRLPDYHDVNVLGSMVEGHPLVKYIANKRPLLAEDYLSLVRSGFVDLAILRKSDDKKVITGVLDASCGPSHGDYVWTRDMAAVGLGKFDINQPKFALKIAEKLYKAYASPSQRNRINGLLGNKELWDTANSNAHIPNTKFSVEEIKAEDGSIKDYELIDCKQPWGMQQLDAYGYFLQLVTKLMDSGDMNLTKLDDSIKEKYSEFYNGNGNRESTLVALSRMLVKIEYWNRKDFGAWENAMHTHRASSMAACISGLKSVYNLFEKKGYFADPDSCPIAVNNEFNEGMSKFKEDLERGIAEGEKVLFSKRIPRHEEATIQDAIETNVGGEEYDERTSNTNREKDAALLFTLVLSDPSLIGENGIGKEQRESILRTVYSLMGEVGFKRFPEDEYMGMNWTTNKHPATRHGEHADNLQANYKPAEWSFFDPYLATYFYKQFTESEGKDLESFLRADRHARRALAQVTKSNYKFERQKHVSEAHEGDMVEINVPAGEVMEHYWFNDKNLKTGEPLPDGQEGHWMAGENYRLNWTKIAMQQMIYHGSKAAELFKEEYPNGWGQQDIVGLNLSALGRKGKNITTSKTTVGTVVA